MTRFLVTGGAGFIGSQIVERLVADGHDVRVLDNFSGGKLSNLDSVKGPIEIIEGDIRSNDVCLQATEGVDFVLHQAALRSVPKSLQCPDEYNDVNIQGTLRLLQASITNAVQGFVFASSSSVYGESGLLPSSETQAPDPISPYALTKLTGEYYCRMFSKHYGLPTVSLRYFNVFGPRQAPDDDYAAVIPKFIVSMLNGGCPTIYGDGEQTRDFTFVEDVVRANLLACSQLLTSDVFNVASGQAVSVASIVATLNALLGTSVSPRFAPARPGDVRHTRANLTKANNDLGFSPKVTFRDGLEKTVEYFRVKAA